MGDFMDWEKEKEFMLKELADRSILLDVALDSSDAGIWYIDMKDPVPMLYYENNFKEVFRFEGNPVFTLAEWGDYLTPILDNEKYADFFRFLREFDGSIERVVTNATLEFPDGMVKYIKNSAQMSYDLDGKPDRMIGMTVDITERTSLLEKNTDMFYKLLGGLSSVVVVTDVHTDEILFYNESAAILFGLEGNGVGIGMPCWQVFRQESGRCARCKNPQLVENPNEVIIWEDYEPLYQKYLKHIEKLVKWPDGRLVHMQESIDITDTKNKEIDISLARDAAERANKAKSNFLSNMSHEIRTPMTAIMGLLDIASQSDDMELIQNCLSKMKTSSAHMLNLLNDVLDMSKIESGNLEIIKEPFYLENMLREMMVVVGVKAHEKKQEILIQIDKKVPKQFIGDSMRLSQVIMNLMFNAIKFSDQGKKIILNILVKEQKKPQTILEFSVTDEGVGVEQANLNVIFDAFRQSDSSITKRYGGTGLGLTISKAIIEKMGGEMYVESQVGKGSTFTFTVRLEAGKEVKSERWCNPGRVLLIDQGELFGVCFFNLLKEHNIACHVAASKEEAAQIIKEQEMEDPIQLIAVDYDVNGENGIEIATTLLNQMKTSPILVLMSMGEMLWLSENARAAGIKYFLQKPVLESSLEELFCEISKSTSGKIKPERRKCPDFSGKRFLVVEDNSINREIARFLLTATGASVIEAENGLAAVELFEKNSQDYDFIFMDIQMPIMDGYSATTRIRESGLPGSKEVPIVAMTANVFREDVKAAFAAGMNGHVGKPINAQELYTMVMDLLNIKSI